MYIFGEGAVRFEMQYYNQRTLAFEPCLEPWSLMVKAQQEYPYTEKVLVISSEQIFNVNLAYGLALTAKQILDRLELS